MAIPTPPAGATVYAHPQGKVIHVHPDGTMDTYKPDGKRASSSATPEKLAAGYGGWARVSGSDAPGPIPELTETETPTSPGPRIPMTFQEADFANAESLISSDRVVVEQKLDGTRVLVVVHEGVVRFLGRNGQPLKHATAAQHFANLRSAFEQLTNPSAHLVLDGEIMQTGELWLFDCPFSEEFVINPTDTLEIRRGVVQWIGGVLHNINDKIRVTPQARTLEEKIELIKAIEAEGGEGIMIKHLDSTYDGGSRVKHSVKVKFVKTADVVVLERDSKGKKKNAKLGVFDPDGNYVINDNERYRVVGNCSMIGKVNAQVGDVIEVAYLYWTGEKLYQPRLLKMRTDKRPIDTSMDQFPDYSRTVIVP